jgi:hypothetical protein
MRFKTAFCSSLNGLLKIASALTLISFSGRDDSDDFFGIVLFLFFPIYVNDNQRRASNQPDRVPALLACLIDTVLNQDPVRIVEYFGRGLE